MFQVKFTAKLYKLKVLTINGNDDYENSKKLNSYLILNMLFFNFLHSFTDFRFM